ncbi:MAG: hypothetical protein OEZ51_09150 [Nitrospinota bacterium]|nr:hypothetical protein [Nitrospinota bacterium]
MPLSSWLKLLQARSGVRFSYTETLPNALLTPSIKELTWEEALRTFLQDYNFLVLWNDGNLAEIKILSSRNSDESAPPAALIGKKAAPSFSPSNPSFASRGNNGLPDSSSPLPPELNQKIDELQKISLFPIRRAIPSQVFDIPVIREFLASQGIQSPVEWQNNPLKARVAKKNALKRIRELLQEHRENALIGNVTSPTSHPRIEDFD